jgi:hypothetical protein
MPPYKKEDLPTRHYEPIQDRHSRPLTLLRQHSQQQGQVITLVCTPTRSPIQTLQEITEFLHALSVENY